MTLFLPFDYFWLGIKARISVNYQTQASSSHFTSFLQHPKFRRRKEVVLLLLLFIFCSTFLIDTITMPTPCGLTRQELDAHNLVENQRCTALFEDRDGNEVTCDKLYSSHPLSTQGK